MNIQFHLPVVPQTTEVDTDTLIKYYEKYYNVKLDKKSILEANPLEDFTYHCNNSYELNEIEDCGFDDLYSLCESIIKSLSCFSRTCIC